MRRWRASGRRRPHTDRVDRSAARARAPTCSSRVAPGYPIDDDCPAPPEVLLAEGDAPRRRSTDARVAVVGTRAATPHGLADAHELGAVLARAGITVVSGLAIGIDAAAHEGALDAGGAVVGVVGTGLDVVYPRRHRALFDRVRARGLLVSELGYGVQPRRRVVPGAQPHHRGAGRRGGRGRGHAEGRRAHHRRARGRVRPPGARVSRLPAQPVGRGHQRADRRRRAASCSNRPTCCSRSSSTPGAPRSTCARRPVGDAAAVLRACGGEPATLDQLASRTGARAVDRGRGGAGARTRAGGWSAHAACAGRDDERRALLAGEAPGRASP